MNTLKHNPWKRIALVEEGGVTQATDGLQVPGGGVIVRNTTVVNGPNTVNQSMVFVPDTRLELLRENNGFYEVVRLGVRN